MSFRFSATEGFGLKFPKPIPCVDDCVGNFISRLTSALITEETFVALHTLLTALLKKNVGSTQKCRVRKSTSMTAGLFSSDQNNWSSIPPWTEGSLLETSSEESEDGRSTSFRRLQANKMPVLVRIPCSRAQHGKWSRQAWFGGNSHG